MEDNSNFWKNRVRESAVLDPIDRISEVLFGMIMVLTFTGAISVSTQDRKEIGDLLWAALGCNVAWGIVDAMMYYMNVLFERNYDLTILKKLKTNRNKKEGIHLLKEEIQPLLAELLTEEELGRLYDRICELPSPEKKHLFSWKDLGSGLQIFFLVFLCTLPVSLPFVFMKDPALALRASNGIALVILFAGGYKLSSYSGLRPILGASLYTLAGILLVAITMAFGG